MTDQPEALLLAADLEMRPASYTRDIQAARLLREQHAEIERLRAEVLAEREECAKVCDDLELPEHHEGTWAAGWSDGTDDCAAAIRARVNP